MKKQSQAVKRGSKSAAVSQPQITPTAVRTSPDIRTREIAQELQAAAPKGVTCVLLNEDGSELIRASLGPENRDLLMRLAAIPNGLTAALVRAAINNTLYHATNADSLSLELQDALAAVSSIKAQVYTLGVAQSALLRHSESAPRMNHDLVHAGFTQLWMGLKDFLENTDGSLGEIIGRLASVNPETTTPILPATRKGNKNE